MEVVVSADKTVILSFDMETDVGSWTRGTRGIVEGTPEILRVLNKHHVPATFFFVGREAGAHAGVVASILAGCGTCSK